MHVILTYMVKYNKSSCRKEWCQQHERNMLSRQSETKKPTVAMLVSSVKRLELYNLYA